MQIRESPYLGIFHAVEFFVTLMSQKVPARCCRYLRYATDSFDCFTIFQRKNFIKFTIILFDVSEGLSTLKTA